MELPVDKITVGERHRKDLGDISELAASIEKIGLLHPVVVLPDYTLVVGERRLAAVKMLGRESIPVNVAKNLEDVAMFVQAECDENTCRKDFLATERFAIGTRIEEIAKEDAKKRKSSGGTEGGKSAGKGRPKDRDSKSFTKPKQDHSKRASSVAAKAAGVSHATYEKIKDVVNAAAAEPEKYQPLVEEMDRTGKVNGAHKKLRVAKQSEQIKAEPPPLPDGPFRVIVVDPPWHYYNHEGVLSHTSTNPYPSMTIDEIKAMDIGKLAHDDCVLWLWTTNSHIRHAWEIIEAWGFEYKTMLTWAKDRMSTGDWLRGQTEHCLMAIRGKPVIALTNQTTLLHGKVREHSRKPDEFYTMVDKLCPGSKCEVFSREERPGWQQHGNDTKKFKK